MLSKALYLSAILLSAHILTAQTRGPAEAAIYFPHIADGGPVIAQWQTRFTFINPNNVAAIVQLGLLSDGGAPLVLNLGGTIGSVFTFTIPPGGTYVLRSQASSSVTVTGWALALSSVPVQATTAFRLVQNGTASLELTAEPTQPSTGYTSVATRQVGVSVANIYGTPLFATVSVRDSAGTPVGQTVITVPALGHSSFNLSSLFPGLSGSFVGSLRIAPLAAGSAIIAWAVYSDSSGVISSLPEGRDVFPGWQYSGINSAFARLVSTFQLLLSDFGTTPQLVISTRNDTNALNASASGGNMVTINLALTELISDSPSELAWVIGHELGHIYQQRTGKRLWYQDLEWDADVWGLLTTLGAGYDPYAAAGALGKLGMATGTANLGIQLWEDSQMSADAHGSFSTRINNLGVFIQAICLVDPGSCSRYKQTVHPHFPSIPSAPLDPVDPSRIGVGASAIEQKVR